MHCMLLLLLGVPGDATAACHPAPPGAGKGASATARATKANYPDEGTDACLLLALRSGRFHFPFFPCTNFAAVVASYS